MEIVDLGPEHEDIYYCCLKPEDRVFAEGVPMKTSIYLGHGISMTRRA